MSLVSVTDLFVHAGVTPLVKGVSLTVAPGEILALVGESGSGKTLTSLALMDLLPAGLKQSGTIVRPPSPSAASSFRGRDIGMIFQEPMTSLNPLHTIGRQITEAITVHQPAIAPDALRLRVQELLDGVGLASFGTRLDAYPHQLSGGQRQRVMIAMAIANNPSLLVADEPTTALDVTVAAQILDLLVALRAKNGMAILFITHDLHLVQRIADRVAVMNQGKIVESGTVEEVFARPKHPYTRQLLSARPKRTLSPLPPDAPTVLEARGVSVGYEERKGFFSWKKTTSKVLDNITLEIKAGTTLGVVGESGSGKTTLALALLRLIRSQGEIVWKSGSREVGKSGNENTVIPDFQKLSSRQLRPYRRHIQMIFQDPFSSLNPRMSAGDIIREGLEVHEAASSRKEKNEKVDAILKEVGLQPEMKHRFPHEFSGGQRQRISIARALVLRPSLIILDEPTSALDISVQAQILDLLLGLQEKYGLSYLFISHDLRTVRAVSHTILVLRQGKMVEYGSNAHIFTRPQTEYTRSLIASALL